MAGSIAKHPAVFVASCPRQILYASAIIRCNQHCISFLLRLADDISLINEEKILHVFCNRVVLFRNVLTDRFFLMILENSVFTPYLYPADPGPQIPFGEGKERVMKQNNPLAFFPQPLCQIKICRAST